MPRQGNTVESCVLVSWRAREGATIAAADILCDVETDKAVFEVPAGFDGTILKLLAAEGDDVPVLEPIAVIGTAGEDWRSAAAGGMAEGTAGPVNDTNPANQTNPAGEAGPAGLGAGPAGEAGPAGLGAGSAGEAGSAGLGAGDAKAARGGLAADPTAGGNVAIPGGNTVTTDSSAALAGGSAVTTGGSAASAVGVSPRARTLAFHECIDPADLRGSGPGGRVLERDVRAAAQSRGPLSAAARAAATGTTALPMMGSGPGGRILLADMQAAILDAQSGAAGIQPAKASGIAQPTDALAPGGPLTGALNGALAFAQAGMAAIPTVTAGGTGPFQPLVQEFPGAFTETAIRSIRKVIAERMRESLATTAQFTLHASAPAVRLQALRNRLKTAPEALGMNGVTVGDIVLYITSRVLRTHPVCNSLKVGDMVRTFERVHLGLAVDTPRGLMVPVIRNADLLSLSAISAEAKRLATACIAGKAAPDELTGSTFTVSNLGALGVDYFTPVINAPEVCVLGVGAILPKAFAQDDGSYALGPAIGLSLTADHQVVDGAPAARLLKDLCAALADADLWIAK
jgi:pyruvate dehydrogenase E2 component (dihydrolipoamide acetyltransferase)